MTPILRWSSPRGPTIGSARATLRRARAIHEFVVVPKTAKLRDCRTIAGPVSRREVYAAAMVRVDDGCSQRAFARIHGAGATHRQCSPHLAVRRRCDSDTPVGASGAGFPAGAGQPFHPLGPVIAHLGRGALHA